MRITSKRGNRWSRRRRGRRRNKESEGVVEIKSIPTYTESGKEFFNEDNEDDDEEKEKETEKGT